jgi:hypothetical protein
VVKTYGIAALDTKTPFWVDVKAQVEETVPEKVSDCVVDWAPVEMTTAAAATASLFKFISTTPFYYYCYFCKMILVIQ